MSIAATRMYRGLDDFLSSDTYDNNLFLSSLRSLREKSHHSVHVPPHNDSRTITVSGTWRTPTVPISLDGINVDVHTSYDTADNQTLTSQAIGHTLDSNMDGHPKDKLHELV
jgi:hypothetical protein